MGMSEDEDVNDEQDMGERRPRKVQSPKLPSQEEIDMHELTHLPYRSWCTHCVRGRGESHPHYKVPEEKRAIKEIHMDYCFMGKKDEKTQPILVIRDRDTKLTCSVLVREKGAADDFVIKRILAFMKELGYEGMRLIIKSDQESPIQAVVIKLIKARGDQVTIPENSPVQSSGSNGVIERAIKEVEAQVRVMKSALDDRAGIDIRGTSNILPWMIEYASVLLNRYLVGKDGRTAHERSRGKTSKMLGFEFGERVHFRRVPLPGRLGKLDSLWQNAIFIGYKTQSGEYVVANDAGVYKTRTMKRMPEAERWAKDALENLKWTPWKLKDSDGVAREDRDQPDHEVMMDIPLDKTIDIPLPPRVEGDSAPRRAYITKAMLDKFGMTEGCMGCTTCAIGGTGVAHSEECRRRIEKMMKADPVQKMKLEEVKTKQRQFIKRHMAKRGLAIEEDTDQEMMDEVGGEQTESETVKRSEAGDGESIIQGRGIKREAEDDPDDPRVKGDRAEDDAMMGVMMCLCENASENDVVEGDAEQDMINMETNKDMEEESRNWADITEKEQEKQEDEENCDEKFYDEVTGKVLKYEKVIAARMEEIEGLIKMGVWEVVPLRDCLNRTQRRPIKGRWVDINKGDDHLEQYRSRYVARELRHQHGGTGREGLFAAMPPIEGLRLLISHTMSRKDAKTQYKLMFLDISKAYLHAEVLRDDIFVDLPKEMRMPGMCGRLRRALYGTREAARCWEKEYSKFLAQLGFQRGRCNPCMFLNARRELRVLVHGDDFTVSGPEEELKKLASEFADKYKTKLRGIIGPDKHDTKAMTILNRIVEWTDAGITLEADPRHVDIVLKELGLEKGNGSDVTGSRLEYDSLHDDCLEVGECTRFRSLAARLNFLSIDRVDIQFACKEICRSMSSPKRSDWEKVKKLGRYLKRNPRHVVWFVEQSTPKFIDTYVDTDYAGCKSTRRSTNGGMMFHGHHLIKGWSTTQTVVALSSGEAEYYGVTKGACESIGLKGIAVDMGVNLGIKIHTDSSAAKGIATRRGIGKVKHLDTRTLWVQDKIDKGIMSIKKVPGETNIADILTKYLPAAKLKDLMAKTPIEGREGRHHLAPRLQGD